MSLIFNRCVLLFVSILSITYLSAAPIVNGDFSDSTGWNTLSSFGSVDLFGGEAVLSTGDFAIIADPILVQGDDGFFSFSDPLMYGPNLSTLTFDTRFESLGTDVTEGGFTLSFDNLVVALYDAVDFSKDLFFIQDIDFSLSSAWSQISLDVSSLADRSFALSFELNDEFDGLNSRVYLDNVAFNSKSVSVSAPDILHLLAFGSLISFLLFRSKKKNQI